MPYSLAAILSTYYDEPCGPCPTKPLQRALNETDFKIEEVSTEFNYTLSNSSKDATEEVLQNSVTNVESDNISHTSSVSTVLEITLTKDNVTTHTSLYLEFCMVKIGMVLSVMFLNLFLVVG